METRSHNQTPQIKDQQVSGYALVFFDGTEATEFRSGNLSERIPSDVEIDLGEFVYACLDHNEAAVLDHTDATLKLSKDRRGLAYSFPLRESDPDHQRLRSKIEGGLINGASFEFQPVKEEWRTEGKNKVRYLRSIKVKHISPVYKGAYPAASTTIRANDPVELQRAYLKHETELRLGRMKS